MKALKLGISKNTTQAFKAGCNLVLHCNGNYKEMLDVAENSPKVDDFIIKKTKINLIVILNIKPKCELLYHQHLELLLLPLH